MALAGNNLRDFIHLNAVRTRSLALWLGGVIGVCCAIAIFCLKDEPYFSWPESILYWVGVSLCCFFVGCTLAMSSAYYAFVAGRKIFNASSFSVFLAEHKFRMVHVHYTSSGFIHESRTGFIGNYPVIIDVPENRPSMVVFSFRLKWMQLSNERIREIDWKLKNHKATLAEECVNILLKRGDTGNAENIYNQLLTVARVLESEKFIPEDEVDFKKVNLYV